MLGNVLSAPSLRVGIYEAAQLHDAGERFDVNVGEFIDRLVLEAGFDGGRDVLVILKAT